MYFCLDGRLSSTKTPFITPLFSSPSIPSKLLQNFVEFMENVLNRTSFKDRHWKGYGKTFSAFFLLIDHLFSVILLLIFLIGRVQSTVSL